MNCWNLVERLAVTAERDVVDVADVTAAAAPASSPAVAEIRSLRHTLEEVEAAILRETLARCGSQAVAAARLGVSQATVARRAKRYRLSR